MCSETDEGLTGVMLSLGVGVQGACAFPCRKPWTSVCVVVQVSKTCRRGYLDVLSKEVFHSRARAYLIKVLYYGLVKERKGSKFSSRLGRGS